MLITPEELLAGKALTYDVEVPPSVLAAGEEGPRNSEAKKIRLRPLTIKDVQLIAKAAQDDEVLTSELMIHRAVVEPKLKQNEIAEMPGGLVRFLVERINRISGLSAGADELKDPFDSLGRHVPLAENRISTAIGSSPSHPSACVLEYILQIGLLHQHCEAE